MNSNSTGGVGNLARQFYLAWKALRDPSIPWAAKWLIPLAAFAYWISPVDLIPFVPVDDIVVVLIALNFFVQNMARYYATKGQGPHQGPEWTNRTQQQHDSDRANGNPGRNPDKTIETTWRVIEE